MDQFSKWGAGWLATAVGISCAIGCGGSEYQKRIQQGVQALRTAAEADGFSAPQQLAGTSVWLRVPEPFKLLAASPTLAHAEYRLKLAEVDLSGKIFTFEALVDYPTEPAAEANQAGGAGATGADAGGETAPSPPPRGEPKKQPTAQTAQKSKVACYLYVAIEDLTATRNRDPIEWFRQKVGLRYGIADLRETEVRTPEGRIIPWQKLSLSQVQAFYYQGEDGREEPRPMPGVVEVYLRHDAQANLLIALAWRVPKVLEDRLQVGKLVGLARLAERTAGMVEVRR